jgi:hypothetical protein
MHAVVGDDVGEGSAAVDAEPHVADASPLTRQEHASHRSPDLHEVTARSNRADLETERRDPAAQAQHVHVERVARRHAVGPGAVGEARRA